MELLIVPGRNLKGGHGGVVRELTGSKPVWTVTDGSPISVSSVSRWTGTAGTRERRRKREIEEGVMSAGVGRLGRLKVEERRGRMVVVTPTAAGRKDGAFEEDEGEVVAMEPVERGLLGVVVTSGGQAVLVGSYLAGTGQQVAERAARKAESYVAALRPMHSLSPRETRHFAPGRARYDPRSLDDPRLKTGKHRTVMALPSYLSSIIQFAPRDDLKDEINEQFRALHPELDPTITLSMIRSLKKKLADVAVDEELELSSVALAYVYFEKLVQARRVGKINRKLVAATCFLLAVKINDAKENTDFSTLFERLEEEFGVTEAMIKQVEFQVFAALEFSLFVAQEEMFPHLERLMRERGVKWEDYGGLGGKGDPWFFVGGEKVG